MSDQAQDPVQAVEQPQEQPAAEPVIQEEPQVVEPQPEATPLTPNESFMQRYEALCEETGLALHFRVESPVADDGTFDSRFHKVVGFVGPK